MEVEFADARWLGNSDCERQLAGAGGSADAQFSRYDCKMDRILMAVWRCYVGKIKQQIYGWSAEEFSA